MICDTSAKYLASCVISLLVYSSPRLLVGLSQGVIVKNAKTKTICCMLSQYSIIVACANLPVIV